MSLTPNSGEPGGAEAALAEGVEHYKAGRAEEAARALERAKTMRRGDVRAHSYLGAAYYRLRRYHEAAEEFRQAAALKGDDPRVFFNLGNAYLGCGLPAQARDAFAAALRADPNYVAALFPLASLERMLGAGTVET
jgi:Flp pilus assembly protein TadD